MDEELIDSLAAIARQIETKKLRDASDEIEAAESALAGTTKAINQVTFDAAVARAAPLSATTVTKLAYSINYAQNELGLLPVVRANLKRAHAQQP